MVRGGWLLLILILLLLPSVSASLSMSCPSSAQATHPFTIRADDASASTIKLFWQSNWHTFSGSYAIGTITEPKSAEHKWRRYFAESYDASGTLLDSTSCDVYIDSADFPGTVSASPSSLQLVVGEHGSITVSGSDNDGIHDLKFGGASYTCSGFGGYPTSCHHTFTVSYSAAGTYSVTPSVQDKWGNVVSGTHVTITVTDPCANYNCDDGNMCTTDSCVVVNGAASCQYTALDAGSWCGSGKYCTDDSPPACLPSCPVPNKCLSSQPANTQQVAFYCSAPQECYACESGFHWEGNDCVADTSCTDECSSGETRCDPNNADASQSCVYNSTSGCWEWGLSAPCPDGETCQGGECTDPCAGLSKRCSDAQSGYERCNKDVVEVCGQPDGVCWQWVQTQNCTSSASYCVQSGNTASCVACRSDNDCAAGETCQQDVCVGVQRGE